jgi:histidyl-tRNA synthetase
MPRPKKTTTTAVTKRTKEKEYKPQLLKGFKDILPNSQGHWELIYNKFIKLAKAYGFLRIDVPILEETQLFIRSVGKQTDIVSKEMFSFVDSGGVNVSLRPEATASIVRAYIEHGMIDRPQPVKLFYWGPMFRREKPQHGRQRQFYQLGVEALGSDKPVLDAQVIALAYNLFQQLGLKEASLQINSLGCASCRQAYVAELVDYYKSKRRFLCDDCKKRLTKNPLRLLDCKQPTCQPIIAQAPQILDFLDEECKNHLMAVLEYLDGLDISYVLNPRIVRGLDYYTRTVFEIWPTEEESGSQSSLAAGGRYDDLVELLGGNPTPACGFAAGVERIILQLKEAGIEPKKERPPEIFLAQIGQQAKIRALKLFDKLRSANLEVAESFTKDSLKAQLELANKLKVKYVLILGQKEVLDDTILIRDMESGVQEIVDQGKVVIEIKKKLGKAV